MKTPTLGDDILHGTARLVGHEANDGEDDTAGEDAGGAVEDGQDAGILVAVVVELVVARHRDEGAPRGPHREEDLHRCLAPHLRDSQGKWW